MTHSRSLQENHATCMHPALSLLISIVQQPNVGVAIVEFPSTIESERQYFIAKKILPVTTMCSNCCATGLKQIMRGALFEEKDNNECIIKAKYLKREREEISSCMILLRAGINLCMTSSVSLDSKTQTRFQSFCVIGLYE